MNTTPCIKCGSIAVRKKNGNCSPCGITYNIKWRAENSEKIKAYNKGSSKRYKEKHPSYYKEYRRKRRLEDVNFRLACDLRARLNVAIAGKFKAGSAVSDLGCSIEFLKQYLEHQFKPGMTWENRLITGWHIDHIIPLSYFDLTNIEQLKKACHYTNLQPLWAEENTQKGAKRPF